MGGTSRISATNDGTTAADERRHTVRRGETLSGIAARYGVSVADILRANRHISNPDCIRAGQTLVIPERVETTNANEEPTTYTVRRGDTLTSIAERHGLDLARLRRANLQITNPDRIYPGQRVNLSPTRQTVYTVRAGDTLTSVAEKFGVGVGDILRANRGRVHNANLIYPGQRLRIPVADSPNETPVNNTETRPRRTTPPPTQPTPTETPDVTTTPDNRTDDTTTVRPAPQTGNGVVNLDEFLSSERGSDALAAVIIGNAEGTRTPSGGYTPAYRGHTDPGDGRGNRGSFSYAPRGANDPVARTPVEADRIQLRRLGAARAGYERAARAAGLDPNDALLASTYFDAYNQSPRAASRMLEQMDYVRQNGVTQESMREWRFRGYVNAATGERWSYQYRGRDGQMHTSLAGEGLARRGRTEEEKQAIIRRDQTRRVDAMVTALRAQELTTTEVENPPAETTGTGETHYTLKNDSIRLSDRAREMMGSIADEYHRRTGRDLVITDGSRTPREQAERMYAGLANGTAESLYTNREALAEIRTAFDAARRAGKSRSEINADVARVIQSQVGRNVYISRHLRGGAVDIRRNGEGGMNAEQRRVFREVVREITGDPPLDEGDHYHLQF